MANKDIELKLSRFEEEIMGEALKICKDIDEEIESYRTTELDKHEDDALAETYGLIQCEVSELSVDATKELSRKKMELKKRLYLKREEYARLIFTEARMRLMEFTKSEGYERFLLAKAAKACAGAVPTENVFLLKKEDLCYAPALLAATGIAAQATENISIGGLLLENKSKGRLVDETLDTALEDQKEWFAGNSGFLVK